MEHAYGAGGTSTAAPFRCEDLFPSFVGAALLGQGDFFFLAFREERAFEFREGTQDGSMRLAIGGVLTDEDYVLFDETPPRTPSRVRPWTRARTSTRLRASRPCCAPTTMSPVAGELE